MTKRFHNAGIEWSVTARPKSVRVNTADEEKPLGRELLAGQKIQFCTSKDGARIAYASVGKGMPIVKAANWLSHLELDWDAPIWSPLFRELAMAHQVVRYDERGNGLSDWEVDDVSFDSFVTDLETVVDANELEKFALLGISQGAAASIEYAVKHPERVSHLILFGAYDTGWGQDNPAYR